jgi:hypothetical protein
MYGITTRDIRHTLGAATGLTNSSELKDGGLLLTFASTVHRDFR